jgi:hypothetical protein
MGMPSGLNASTPPAPRETFSLGRLMTALTLLSSAAWWALSAQLGL